MYNIFSKFKKQKRTKSSTTNVRRDIIEEKINAHKNANSNLFLKTLQKHPVKNKEENRPIRSSHGYRSVYFNEKIKLVPESIHNINSQNNENLIIETDANMKTIKQENNYVDYPVIKNNFEDENEKNNKECKRNFSTQPNQENTPLNLTSNNKTQIKNFHLINSNNNNNINKSLAKNTLNTSRRNMNQNDLLLKIIYPDETSDKIISESKKAMETKKEIRSKIYKILNSIQGCPLCDDFISKVDGFNRKLVNSLQSDFKINREKQKCLHFQYCQKPKSEPEKDLYMNTNKIKQTKIPLEKLLRTNFTQEELDIIKYDLDFFNKNNKIINTIKFLKPKSLLKKITEEEIELEMEKRRKEIAEKKLKNMGAYKYLKFFINKKITEFRERRKAKQNIQAERQKKNESAENENKFLDLNNNISKKITSMINLNTKQAIKDSKHVNNILFALDRQINDNKKTSCLIGSNLPDCVRVTYNTTNNNVYNNTNTKPISGKNRPISTNRGTNDNFISTEAFSSRNICRPFSKGERDYLRRDSREDKTAESIFETQKTVFNYNGSKNKIYERKNLVEKCVIHNRLIKNKKKEIIENEKKKIEEDCILGIYLEEIKRNFLHKKNK